MKQEARPAVVCVQRADGIRLFTINMLEINMEEFLEDAGY